MSEAAVTGSVMRAGVFPRGGRRLVVYVVYDRRGGVDEYVAFALAGLREHAAEILVVVNGSLTDEGRARLEPVSDEILVRENVGFDIWAHKAALDHVGGRLGGFDEIILTNDTWFGPVRPYGPVFDRMSERAVHFWGMTDHAREEPNPFTGKGVLAYHLQSFWIAVRREMFLSEEWAKYWRELPEMPSYFDAVLQHEAVFTERFTNVGFTVDVAYPSEQYPTDHPALFNPAILLADGCPLLKRRPFFHWPPFLDRHAVIGRELMHEVERYGYPSGLILANLARTVQPKVINANLGMLEVLDDADLSEGVSSGLSVLVVAHVDHPERAGELLGRLGSFPDPVDLIVTTSQPADRDVLETQLAALSASVVRAGEVRVVPSAWGRDTSAFLIGCRDVLLQAQHDVVVKIHDRTPVRRGRNHARYFRRHQLDNLLGSPGFVRNLLALFAREPGLGLVYPPMIHIGYATMGEGWGWYRGRGHEVAEALGIQVPFDGVSPLAPLGGMWMARPEALRVLVEADWTYEDFRLQPRKKVPALDRVIERLVSMAAGERGFHTRTVIDRRHAALSHLALEYKTDQLATTLPGYPVEQIQFLHRAGWTGTGGAVAFIRMYMRMNHPGLVKRLDPVMHPVGRAARAVLRGARTMVHGARQMTGARRR
jgi:rhamnosyltransferase